ncbi:MAG: DUF4012 domain-containing protein [Ardenticatenaceae bacterium]|nr:DUF4012 domain-containing protein [Anaerolineales bacterium]MCB8921687.1 DUF4012 domain-containing protein [Ardenticatenaceae bacterium]MCB9003281.1 DUF4012 domain-containing protein [Ardenticatenaceae bacterium]
MTIRQHPLLRWLILLGVLLIVAWMGLKTWRIYRAATSLLAQQAEVETLLANGPTAVDPDAAEALIMGVREDLLVIKQETAVFLPITPYLGWLPKVGPLLVKATPLLDMADAGIETAAYAIRGLKPGLTILQNEALGGTDKLAGLVAVLDMARPDLAAAANAFDRYAAARTELGDPTDLPWRVRTLLEAVDAYQSLAQDGLQLAQIAPTMLGTEGARTYLILAQNEDELRPTGGFITGAGVLTVQNGQITQVFFHEDPYYINDWRTKPYAFPPQPLYDLMGLELFLFRDANFWPDFPTSAQMALDLYSYGQDVSMLDGVIATDQRGIQILMSALGAVHIPGEDVTINAQNVIEVMQAAWGIAEGENISEWIVGRKGFIGEFAQAILNKVTEDFGSIDPINLLQAVETAVTNKHLQLYMRDPVEAAVLDAVGWDGRLQNETGQDVLSVIDTNVGYNKVNSLIERQINYHVNLSNRQAQLDVTYQHNGTAQTEPCYQGTPYTAGISYTDRVNTCYWDYVRIYAPLDTLLLNGPQHDIPGETLFTGQSWQKPAQIIAEPVPLAVIADAFLLPRTQTLTNSYTYQLPVSVIRSVNGQEQYQLTVYKQAGTPAQTLQVVIQLPSGASVVSVNPQPLETTDTTITFAIQQDSDLHLQITYQP